MKTLYGIVKNTRIFAPDVSESTKQEVREFLAEHNNDDYIVAVDFDGTLCEEKYPLCGEPNRWLIATIKELQKYGVKFVLWTCREGNYLNEAIEFCKKYNLVFDATNYNLQSRIDKWNDCRKIGANEYWDDRAICVSY